MKSDLKDCSGLISQMRQARGDVAKGHKAVEAGLGILLLPSCKTQGSSRQNGEKRCVSSEQTEKCFARVGTISQQRVPGVTAEFGASGEDPGPVE